MFASISEEAIPQPLYLKKKQIFMQTIRKRQRQKIINQLRQEAMFPSQLTELVKSLPQSVCKLMKYVASEDLPGMWGSIIAKNIVEFIRQDATSIFTSQFLMPIEQVQVLMFVMRRTEYIQDLMDVPFKLLLRYSQNWPQDTRADLLQIIVQGLRRQSCQLYLAEKVLSNLPKHRLYYSQLKFYDFLLRTLPEELLKRDWLSVQRVKTMVQQLSSSYYQQRQRIKMVQVLVQLLYLSEDQKYGKVMLQYRIIDKLHSYIQYQKDDRLLTDRCLTLIYNLNIDQGSQIFMNHQCFAGVIRQMQDKNVPLKLRILMVEVWISAYSTYNKEEISKQLISYVQNNIKLFMKVLKYVLEEFQYEKQLLNQVLDFLHKLMLINQNQGNGHIVQKIRENSRLIKVLQDLRWQGIDLLNKKEVI